MNDRVPNYHEMEENECQIPTSSRFNKGEADMMEELMWQNGQIVVQRPSKKIESAEQSAMMRENQQQNVFMQEDEMASWLHYPLAIDDSSFDRDFCADLLYSAPPPPAPTITAIAPPHVQNFAHFSRIIPGRAASKVRESTTVVESNETPTVRPVEDSAAPVNTGDECRKRKVTDTTEDIESRSEETEIEAAEAKKQTRGSSSSNKRSRAAEVHNLSERRRRDRINEKMKTLQELIPRCNKSDKASMLDEAIDYLKSLQMQVQMMSMGCGMIPMMYPGMQQYVPTMGMGMGPMGMGMGMGMGMNRSMVPYPSMLPGSSIPNPAAAAPIVPTFPMPGFQLQQVPVPDPTRAQAPNQTDHVMNTLVAHSSNQPQMPNFADPYQQFLGLHSAQIPLPQNQTVVQSSAGKPSTSKHIGNAENQQTG